jgi:uncharacterized protein YcfJ
MKYILATTAILLSTSAYAETVTSNVRDHYRNETVHTPINSVECNNVQVPIYREQRNGGNGGDVLAGMIIGGLLGKGITGNDNGAAAGAVMGGVIAADGGTERVISGYRTERQCQDVTTYQTSTRQAYSHSTITFTVDGRSYTLDFVK